MGFTEKLRLSKFRRSFAKFDWKDTINKSDIEKLCSVNVTMETSILVI